MITSYGPAEHFQTVVQQGDKQKNLSPPAQLPRNSARDQRMSKALAGMTVNNTTPHDSPQFTAIREQIKSAVDCLDHKFDYDF